MFIVMAHEFDDYDAEYVYPVKLFKTKEQAKKFVSDKELSFVDYNIVEMEVEKE